MRWRRWIGCMVAGLGMMLATVACHGDHAKPVDFTVTFHDAHGLQVGQPLVYHGVAIGEVQKVDLNSTGRVEAVLRVEAEYVDRVYSEAEFIVENPRGLLDRSDKRQLTMKDRSTKIRTPIHPGDIVEGTDGWLQRTWHRAADVSEWLGDRGQRLLQEAEEWKESPEGQEFLDSLRELLGRANDEGSARWEEFREDHLPELRDRALALKRRLIEQGRSNDAQKLWKSFQQFEERIEVESSQSDTHKEPGGE